MARPRLEYKVKRNGNSVQVYKDGAYIGTISLPKLCLLLTPVQSKSTSEVSAQGEYIKQVGEIPISGTGSAGGVLR